MPDNQKRRFTPYGKKVERKHQPSPRSIPEDHAALRQEQWDTLNTGDKYWAGKEWVEIGTTKRLETMNRDGVTFIRYIGTNLEKFNTATRYQVVWGREWKPNFREDRKDAESALAALGYKALGLSNGGDDDFIVVDHERKEWGYFESGTSPFNDETEEFPKTKTLAYWHHHT